MKRKQKQDWEPDPNIKTLLTTPLPPQINTQLIQPQTSLSTKYYKCPVVIAQVKK